MSKELLIHLANTLWLKHKIHIDTHHLDIALQEYEKIKGAII